MNSANDMMRNAPNTADLYLRKAIECIDEQFGEGYAKDHPELVGTFMRVCAADFAASMGSSAVELIGVSIANRG